ncbi:MAG: hypothetical protein JXB26_16820 [Candidatus Aminicenantes bacterium]|nr:hypothetical protein [Candidatus Aminicenantes bacterium]
MMIISAWLSPALSPGIRLGPAGRADVVASLSLQLRGFLLLEKKETVFALLWKVFIKTELWAK